MRKVLVSFFFLGYVPLLPGTAGSAAAAGIYLALRYLGVSSPWCFLSLSGVFFCLTALLGKWAIRYYRNPDPRRVVSDEVSGYFMSVSLFIPTAPVRAAFSAFLLFRLFDIIKPPPCRRLEKLPRGYGIAADDIMAGIWANLVLHALILVCKRLEIGL